jgi:ABC-type sugar transport system permease subunit
MTVSVALLILGSLKVFDLPLAMTEGGPGRSTILMTQSIIIQGLSSSRIGLASAMSFLFFLVIAVVTFTQVTLMSRQEVED